MKSARIMDQLQSIRRLYASRKCLGRLLLAKLYYYVSDFEQIHPEKDKEQLVQQKHFPLLIL